MQFLKKLFKDETIIGLSGLRKKEAFVKVHIPEYYKKTYITNGAQNYLLI